MKQPRAPIVNFKTALAIAFAAHIFIVLGLSFVAGKNPATQPMSVTVSISKKDTPKPTSADHIASNNQQASGTSEKGLVPTTTEQANRNGNKVKETQKVAKQQQRVAAQQSVITTQANKTEKVLDENLQEEQDGQDSGQDDINKQLAEIRALEARLAKEQQAYAQRPKIHRFTSIAALAAVDAEYQRHWQEKVEAIGNANYPRTAVNKSLSGDVTLKVSVNKNGSLKAVELIKSSGVKLLDQSAIASVQLAAPFLAFPPELAKKADILEIFRTWQFRNNQVTTVEGA